MDPITPPEASLQWQDDFPVSIRFDDPYFSDASGLDEARHVFLRGNGLPRRYGEGFHIAELGFGTGLNLLAAWQAWQGKGRLRFTSFEAYPMAPADMARALGVWPELAPLAQKLLANGGRSFCTDTLEFTLITGDARQTLPAWQGRADAWFLDGFSPAKNPELWGSELLAQVGAHTAPHGTLATYTAAGHVRRALQGGFDVQRVSGFGRKRHMSIGVRQGD